jgi:O-Antigen ligase
MTSITARTRGRSIRRWPADALSVVRKGQCQYRTTSIERLLLQVMVVLIPFELSLPIIAGNSTLYIIFAMLAGYTLLKRPRALAKTWRHPVFLAAFVLLILAALIESAHPFSSYIRIFRIGQTFVAAIFVASLCRDRRALHASMYGFLIAGVLVSILLFSTSYGALWQATATNFAEASRVRQTALADAMETTGGSSIPPGLGAVVALAFGLTAKSAKRRNLFFGIALFCTVATFMVMSRGGMVMVGVSCATVIFVYGVRHVRALLIATALAIGVLIWVPGAVFARLSFTQEFHEGEGGTRTRVYKAAIDHLPEYILTGVGAGNFWGPWGERTAFYGVTNRIVYGAHNAFIQVMITWGLTGLLMLLVVIYLAYRCLPRGGGKDALVLCLYGIAVALLFQMMVTHGLTAKYYAVALGILVGGHRWIWPKSIILSARWGQGRRYSAFEHG